MKAPPITILFVSSIAIFSFIGLFEQTSTLHRFTNAILSGSSTSATKTANNNKKQRSERHRKRQQRPHHPSLPIPQHHHPYKLADGRILYFQHLHKSGGTAICRLAVANRMRADAAHNCNVQTDQRCCGRRDDPDAVANFASTTAYTFVANERDMYATMDTTRFRYMTVLRKSRERYVSHYKHVYREHYYHQQQQEKTGGISFTDWWKSQPDNFVTRKLCGPRCRDVSKYQIDAGLFDYTVQRLHMFEDILLLEDFSKSVRRFSERVGWNVTTILPSAEAAASSINADPKDKTFYAAVVNDEALWDPLMSSLDDALYELAQQQQLNGDTPSAPKFTSAIAEQLATYFIKGPKVNCSNPCCSSTCSKYR